MNADTNQRRFRVGTVLRRASDGDSELMTVARFDGPADSHVVEPNGDVLLHLSAALPKPGVYTTSLDVSTVAIVNGREVERIERQIPIEVTREMEAVPADFLVTPKSVSLVWPWFIFREHSVSVLMLRNAGTKPIEFNKPEVIGLTREDGPDRSSGLAVASLPTLASDGCVSPLPPGQSCDLKLKMGEWLLPSVYGVEVGVGGPGGGWSSKTVRIAVRASLFFAFLTALAGVWTGVFIDEWRQRGRPMLEGLETVTRLRNRMAGPVPDDLALAAADLRARVDQAGVAYERSVGKAGDIDRLSKAVDRLASAIQLSRAFNDLSPDGRRTIAPRYRAVRTGLTQIDGPQEVLDRASAAVPVLAKDIAAWPGAEYAADAAVRLADELGILDTKVQPPLADLSGLAGDASVLRTTAAAIGRPALASNLDGKALEDNIDKRRFAVDDAVNSGVAAGKEAAKRLVDNCVSAAGDPNAAATADLRRKGEAWNVTAGEDPAARVRDLAKLWIGFNALGKAAGTEAAADTEAADPGVASAASIAPAALSPAGASEIFTSFGVHYGQSLAELQAARKRQQTLSNFLVAGLAALGSISAVASNDAWGSPGDVTTIFLAGVGTRILIGALGSQSAR